MARYKDYDYKQTKLIPIAFSEQILPGTFEYTLDYLIDNEVDLTVFEGLCCTRSVNADFLGAVSLLMPRNSCPACRAGSSC